MPTINPRINVTLSPSLDRLVQRLASHQRQSKSQVLRELLEAAEPALQRAVALMDAASKASAEVKSGLARSMEKAQDSIEDAAAIALYRLEAATTDLVDAAEAVKGRRPARRRSAAPGAVPSSPKGGNPPASNRGVKSASKGPTKSRSPRFVPPKGGVQ